MRLDPRNEKINDIKVSGLNGETICRQCRKKMPRCGNLRVTLSRTKPKDKESSWRDVYVHNTPKCYGQFRKRFHIDAMAELFGA